MTTASAPGKLVLTGEYAVLAGAPAIVTAVDRRAYARLGSAAACRVAAKGIDAAPASFEYGPGGRLRWHEAGAAEDYALVAAVMAALADDAPLPVGRDFELNLDTSAFHQDRRKLGLGSSAALTVATTAALCRHFGIDFDTAFASAAHRRFQGGAGSGLDIAAATTGGLIRFRAGGEGPAVEPLAWPAGVEAVFVWTGHSAATAPRVRRFEAWADTAGSAPILDALGEAAGRAAAAWQSGTPDAVMSATAAWAAMLMELAQAAGLDIWSGGHDRLARLAATAGVVYKPSGAGGGDIGLALSADPDRRHAFASRVVQEGFHVLALGPDARGVSALE
ncbi:MAG: hypothetical protein P8172_02225 [Gammaproteobacteria bacterium]